MDILDFARKNKAAISLNPDDIRTELKAINQRFEKQWPSVKPEFKPAKCK